MANNFTLPAEVALTVDDLRILPDELHYELIDGRLDIQERAPLSGLGALAMLASLRISCPPDCAVAPAVPLLGGDLPPTHVVVTGSSGIALVVDVVQRDWLFADVRARMAAYVGMGVPRYWLVEVIEWRGACLTDFAA